jgi:hypothetical protein
MANRIGTFPTFANLAPPWSLPTLDANFVSVNTAFNDSSLGFSNVGIDSGTSGNYVVTLAYGAPSAYNQGMLLSFLPLNANTGSSSVTVNPLGSVSILTPSGNPLPANALAPGVLATMVFSGTAFYLLGGLVNNPLNSTLGLISSPGTTTINCSGFSSVRIQATLGSGGSYTFSLTNLALGVPVDIQIITQSATRLFKVAATTPASVSYLCLAIYQGATTQFASTSDNAANHLLYHGVSMLNTSTSTPDLYLQASYS